MKPQYTARNTLYEVLDKLVNFFVANKKALPEIVLNKAQFQIFKEFNDAVDGEYRYRNFKIRCL